MSIDAARPSTAPSSRAPRRPTSLHRRPSAFRSTWKTQANLPGFPDENCFSRGEERSALSFYFNSAAEEPQMWAETGRDKLQVEATFKFEDTQA